MSFACLAAGFSLAAQGVSGAVVCPPTFLGPACCRALERRFSSCRLSRTKRDNSIQLLVELGGELTAFVGEVLGWNVSFTYQKFDRCCRHQAEVHMEDLVIKIQDERERERAGSGRQGARER